jgi:hypothetical protein
MNRIKRLVIIIGLASLIAAPAVTAQPLYKYKVHTAGGVAYDSGTNYAIIGANSVNSGQPCVTFLDAQAAATSGVVVYGCTNTCLATVATTNVRTNSVNTTNGFPVGTIVVVRHKGNERYERLLIKTLVSSNQIAFNTDPLQALAIGDVIYAQYAKSVIPVNVTNVPTLSYAAKLTGTCIATGPPGYPLLLDCTNGTINTVSARFE